MLLVAPQAQAATRQVGIDIPVQWYADDSGQMTLDRFAALPTDQLATTRQILLWLFAKNLVAAQRAAGHVVCRGAALAAAGPHFRRPSDHLLPAAGQRWPVDAAHLWRSRRRPRKRSALSGKGADTAPPPTAAGYELVFRLQSTSTLILLASLSSAQAFVQRATADTAFWSFYFGLAAVASGVALAGAGPAPASAMGICLFSLNYPLVAALHGFPEWFFGHAALPFQDFMISSLAVQLCHRPLAAQRDF